MNNERSSRPLIGAILEDKFGLTEAKLLEAINVQGTKGGRLGEILIRLRAISEEQLLQALAIQFELPWLPNLDVSQVDHEWVKKVPIHFARRYHVLPLKLEDGAVLVAPTDPMESAAFDDLRLHAVANAQKAGGIGAFIDAEHALDPDYAKALGVDTDALLVSQPDTGEQALEITDMLIRSGALDIVVIDSVAALVPRAEIEGEMGDSHVGLQARLMSQALRKITGALSTAGTTAVFINQLREKIGVMFGSPETTTGGRALKFYASIRLDVRRIESLKDGTDIVGNRTRVKVVKNKVASPFKQAEFDIMYGKGISREGSLIDVGVEQSIIRKAGAWYTYEGDQLGQGKENARNFLRENPDVAAEIEKRIKEKLGVGVNPSADAAGGLADPPVDF